MVARPNLPRFASDLLSRALGVSPVVESGDQLLAIEVKATTRPRIRDITGLQLFRQEYRDRFVGGLLLHAGSKVEWLADGILAAPWWRVL